MTRQLIVCEQLYVLRHNSVLPTSVMVSTHCSIPRYAGKLFSVSGKTTREPVQVYPETTSNLANNFNKSWKKEGKDI